MHLIVLVAVLIYLVWLNGRNRRMARSVKEQASEAEANWRSATERVVDLEKRLVQYRKTVQEYRELESEMIRLAICREDRAIAAVEAILRSNGCTAEQISLVVEEIKTGAK